MGLPACLTPFSLVGTPYKKLKFDPSDSFILHDSMVEAITYKKRYQFVYHISCVKTKGRQQQLYQQLMTGRDEKT